MDYQTFKELLPAGVRPQVDEIWGRTAGSDARLSLCVAGAFSTGKTSLLNSLLGENILPVAMEESTTLPTFIGYGDTPRFRLLAGDEVRELERENLAAVITSPPEGARLLDVALPFPWLQGLQIIDLPGTGSTSTVRLEYGREVMRQADAVIYLIANRGPTRADLEDLRTLHFLGKKIFLGVSQWDRLEQAIAQGEQAPALSAWARVIRDECGIDMPLVPVDKFGRGAGEVLAFLSAAVSSLEAVRLERFRAEAAPIIANLLAEHEQAIRVLGVKSEDEARQVHQSLLREKEALLRERQNAHQDQKKETESILGQWDSGNREIEKSLTGQLQSLAEQWQTVDGQESFLQDGKSLVQQALEEAALLGRTLSAKYGAMEVEIPELGDRRIRLSPPPPLQIEEFLDTARYGLLQERLKELTQMQEKLREAPQEDREAVKAEAAEREAQLEQLERQYREISSLPIPRYEERVEGTSSGRFIGRVVGEICDLALIFAAPYVAGTSKAAQIVRGTGKVVTFAKTGQTDTAAEPSGEAKGNEEKKGRSGKGKKGKTADTGKDGAEQPAVPNLAQSLALLEKLTLGHWGEKIGSFFDEDPQIRLRVDRVALEQREQAKRALEEKIGKMQLELHGLEQRLKQPGADTAALTKEIARVREQLNEAKARAEQKMADAQSVKEQEFRTMLGYEKEKCRKEWLRHFEIQSRSMRSLLAAAMKGWWEEYLPTILAEKEAQVKKLLEELDGQPARRQEQERQLRKEMGDLEAAARMLA